MVRQNLENGYQTIDSLVDNSMEEVYFNIKRFLNKFEDNFGDELSFMMRGRDQYVVQRSKKKIEEIVDEHKYQFKREIARYSNQILEACQELYRGMIAVIESDLPLDEKKNSIDKLIFEYTYTGKSLMTRSRNQEFEMFDELDRYFRRSLDEDEILYYDIKSCLNRAKSNFSEEFSSAIGAIISAPTHQLRSDVKDHLEVYFREEFEKASIKDQKQEQRIEAMQNDSGYKFNQRVSLFASNVGLILSEKLDTTDLSLQLYEIYQKNIKPIEEISSQIVSFIDKAFEKGVSELNSSASASLNNFFGVIQKLNNVDFSGDVFEKFIQQVVGGKTLSPKVKEFFDALVKTSKNEYNSFMHTRLSEICQYTLDSVNRYYKYMLAHKTKIDGEAYGGPGEEVPSGPKM